MKVSTERDGLLAHCYPIFTLEATTPSQCEEEHEENNKETPVTDIQGVLLRYGSPLLGTMLPESNDATPLTSIASKFENLRMEDDESLGSFISKISLLANEVSMLGKKYNEKKLVKKVLRCFPPCFEAYKAVLKITVNTDKMKFDTLVQRKGDMDIGKGMIYWFSTR
ncbi:hypothetical protein Rs2_03179 [Raphanus sativus]|nr:hypothetical protein Rs2_03179 [Raphanus sativus]